MFWSWCRCERWYCHQGLEHGYDWHRTQIQFAYPVVIDASVRVLVIEHEGA